MASLTDYFERKNEDAPRPKFTLGDRVFGRREKIPFVGSVLREIESVVMIQTDLPVVFEGEVCNIITVGRECVTRLQELA
jgi:hypothetical protein